MITVGYGDILPENPIEMVACIVTMLFACGVFAYSVNAIGMIFEAFNSEETAIKQNLYIINNYMN